MFVSMGRRSGHCERRRKRGAAHRYLPCYIHRVRGLRGAAAADAAALGAGLTCLPNLRDLALELRGAALGLAGAYALGQGLRGY